MTENARLRWLCRRGMKELDVLLEHYLAQHYPDAPESERAAFRAVLDLDDPVLWYYVMGRDAPADKDMQLVIGKLVTALQR